MTPSSDKPLKQLSDHDKLLAFRHRNATFCSLENQRKILEKQGLKNKSKRLLLALTIQDCLSDKFIPDDVIIMRPTRPIKHHKMWLP